MKRDVSSAKVVFLDRDGVINRKVPEGQYVKAWSQFQLLPGAVEAIVKLKHAGLLVIVVTNQRGIALGLYRAEDVDRIHARLQQELAAQNAQIDGFYICPHDRDTCNCRKPLTGLWEKAKAAFPEIQPETSLLIGDSLSDIEFGRNLEMTTIFIEGEVTDGGHPDTDDVNAAELADLRFPSFSDAVDALRAPGLHDEESSTAA